MFEDWGNRLAADMQVAVVSGFQRHFTSSVGGHLEKTGDIVGNKRGTVLVRVALIRDAGAKVDTGFAISLRASY
ncbi:MAG TPA: hypothetical protein VFS91_06645 [Nitrobacter sp.]|nr:hypothetical protein [Nitrobacter sp.]